MNELTDFLCGCMIQIGNYLKIKKLALGWAISMGAILYWVVRGFHTGYMAQSFWHGVSFCMAAYGFLAWQSKEDK